MRYKLFHNVSDDRFFGYEHGHPVWSDGGVYEIADRPDEAALDVVFSRHNRPDRPDGLVAPSLSVGDVIFVVNDAPVESSEWFAVADIGFEPIDPPSDVVVAAGWRDARDIV